MAETVAGSVSSNTSFLDTTTVAGTNYTGKPGLSYSKNFASTDISAVFHGTYTVTTTPTVIDVTALTSAYGAAISFATVKHLQIVNNHASIGLTAGGGTAALFSALPTIAGGGCVNLTTPLAVTPSGMGAAKNITLTAASGSITVDVLIVGN